MGKLTDLSLMPGETLLEISRIVYTSNILGEKVILPLSSVSSINDDIRLDLARDEIPPGKLSLTGAPGNRDHFRSADRGH